MKLMTAINLLQGEADFLGQPLLETLEDIKKHGRMVYGEKTMEAYTTFLVQGQKFFAEVE
jgi:hypothetical protein